MPLPKRLLSAFFSLSALCRAGQQGGLIRRALPEESQLAQVNGSQAANGSAAEPPAPARPVPARANASAAAEEPPEGAVTTVHDRDGRPMQLAIEVDGTVAKAPETNAAAGPPPDATQEALDVAEAETLDEEDGTASFLGGNASVEGSKDSVDDEGDWEKEESEEEDEGEEGEGVESLLEFADEEDPEMLQEGESAEPGAEPELSAADDDDADDDDGTADGGNAGAKTVGQHAQAADDDDQEPSSLSARAERDEAELREAAKDLKILAREARAQEQKGGQKA